MAPRIITDLRDGNPWEGVEMPEGFDPDANRFLNPNFDGVPDLDFLANPKLTGSADLSYSPDEEVKTYSQWVDYANQLGKGKYFASMADLYKVFKFVVYGPQEEQIKRGTSLEHLQSVMGVRNRSFITATRMTHAASVDALGSITRNEGSDRDYIHNSILIPDFGGPIEEVIAQPGCIEYFRALLGAESDSPETIVQVLQGVLGIDLYVGSASKASRDEGTTLYTTCLISYDTSMPAAKGVINCAFPIIKGAGPEPEAAAFAAIYKSEEASR